MENVYLAIVLAPLLAAIVAGLFGKWIGRAGAHTITILGVAIAFALSAYVLKAHVLDGLPDFNGPVYTWLVTDGLRMEVGFLVDHLTAMMMVVVTFVSLMVHVYTIGYMHDDLGYQRFFSYISLFTFSMLMLVMSNNFLQLFFGWEAVGLVSYLLIGFWYTRPTAIYANLKAFLVNRVGDFGFLLGIALIAAYAGSLDYAEVFAKRHELAAMTEAGSSTRRTRQECWSTCTTLPSRPCSAITRLPTLTPWAWPTSRRTPDSQLCGSRLTRRARMPPDTPLEDISRRPSQRQRRWFSALMRCSWRCSSRLRTWLGFESLWPAARPAVTTPLTGPSPGSGAPSLSAWAEAAERNRLEASRARAAVHPSEVRWATRFLGE